MYKLNSFDKGSEAITSKLYFFLSVILYLFILELHPSCLSRKYYLKRNQNTGLIEARETQSMYVNFLPKMVVYDIHCCTFKYLLKSQLFVDTCQQLKIVHCPAKATHLGETQLHSRTRQQTRTMAWVYFIRPWHGIHHRLTFSLTQSEI